MSAIHLNLSREDFVALSRDANLIPVFTELAADFETPLSAFQKLTDETPAFLFESAEMNDHAGRYSFLGTNPTAVLVARGSEVTITEEGGDKATVIESKDPLRTLEDFMAKFRPAPDDALPLFHGGAVGYLSYDMVRVFEPSISAPPPDQIGAPEMIFMVADSVVIFDHRFRKIQIVANAFTERFDDPGLAYDAASETIATIIERLSRPFKSQPLEAFSDPVESSDDAALQARSNTTQAEYEAMVVKAKEYISAGDIFQVVPSQRFEVEFDAEPFNLYRALRHVNPSPYMFFLKLPDDLHVVGSSPEVHVRAIEGKIEIRPIAGTRWRGRTPEEDDALADELLADPKERAEHIMLVDLARNDVGRASEFSSVEVDDLMIIERYSHVMHIVSNVTGRLAEGCSSYDVMRATFPAGTVSGSPKIRAMQIINELEKSKRGVYAGAVGYFGFDGNLDSSIALRTCVLKDGKAYVQAGAGVVADSDPTYEYEETCNKAAAILRALRRAAELA